MPWKITGCSLRSYVDDSNFSFLESTIEVSRIPWNIVFKFFGLSTILASFGLVSFSLITRNDRLSFLITVMLTIVAWTLPYQKSYLLLQPSDLQRDI